MPMTIEKAQPTPRYLLRINTGEVCNPQGPNLAFLVQQKRLEVLLHHEAGMRWSKDGAVLFDAYRLPLPPATEPTPCREQVRLWSTPGKPHLFVEIAPPETLASIRSAVAWTACARYVAERGLPAWTVDRLADEMRVHNGPWDGAKAITDEPVAVPSAPSYHGRAGYIVLNHNDGQLKVETFENKAQAQAFQDERRDIEPSAPVSAPIAVPSTVQLDRMALVEFVGTVIHSAYEVRDKDAAQEPAVKPSNAPGM